jgi:predicted transcriptional regulator
MNKLKLFKTEEFLAENLKNPEFRLEWEKMEPQYQLEREMIKARIEKHMTQAELAKKANTTQAVISRIESMAVSPSLNTVNKIAMAFGKKLQIRFVSPD